MAKGGRKKKEKKKEFQKVKLKVGKRKLPANNATDISFKSQAIYLPDQLKSNNPTDEPLGKGRRSLLDLLIQVGHFNANVRIDALKSIKLLLSENTPLVETHIIKLIEKLPKILSDHESQARKACVGIFNVIFSNLNEDQMMPFFNIISTNLQCALCHLHESVQQDALEMFDLCLQYFPKLLCGQNKFSILNQFLELISVKQNSAASKNTVKGARVLSMQLSGKESSVSWRIKVLKRLENFLNAIFNLEENNTRKTGEKIIKLKWDSKSKFNTMQNTVWLIKEKISIVHQNSSPIFTSLNKEIQLDSNELYDNISAIIIPLMLDCCIETNQGFGSPVSPEGVTTLYHAVGIILSVVENLCETSTSKLHAISKIRNLYLQDFIKHFFQAFPFRNNVQITRRPGTQQRERFRKDIEAFIIATNLRTAILLSLLLNEHDIENEDPVILNALSSTAQYIGNLLAITNNSEMEIYKLNSILKTLKILLNNAGDDFTMDNILKPLVQYCDNLPHSEQKMITMKFLFDLYSTQNFNCEAMFDEWTGVITNFLSTLVHEVEKMDVGPGTCKWNEYYTKSFELIMRVIRNRLYMNEWHFFGRAFQNSYYILLQIFKDNIEKIFCHPNLDIDRNVVYCEKCTSIQEDFVNSTIQQVFTFHNEEVCEFEALRLFLSCLEINPTVVSASIELLLYRIKPIHALSYHLYETDERAVFKIIFELLLGTSIEILWHQLAPNTDVISTLYEIRWNDMTYDELSRHKEICKVVQSRITWLIAHYPNFISFIPSFLKKLLSNVRIFRPPTALGIIYLIDMVIIEISGLNLHNMAQVCGDILICCTKYHKTDAYVILQSKCIQSLRAFTPLLDSWITIIDDMDITGDNAEILTSIVSKIFLKSKQQVEKHENKFLKNFFSKLKNSRIAVNEQWFFDFKFKVEAI